MGRKNEWEGCSGVKAGDLIEGPDKKRKGKDGHILQKHPNRATGMDSDKLQKLLIFGTFHTEHTRLTVI